MGGGVDGIVRSALAHAATRAAAPVLALVLLGVALAGRSLIRRQACTTFEVDQPLRVLAASGVLVAGVASIGAGLVQGFTGEPTEASRGLTIFGPTVITLWLMVIGFVLVRMGRESSGSPTRG